LRRIDDTKSDAARRDRYMSRRQVPNEVAALLDRAIKDE
jgi:hypothetical protein